MGGQIRQAMPIRTGKLVSDLKSAGIGLVNAYPFTNKTRIMFENGLLVETAGGKQRAFMSNPYSGWEAVNYSYNKIIFSISEGIFKKEANFREAVLAAVEKFSNEDNKPKNEFRMQIHFHIESFRAREDGSTVFFNNPRDMKDDGVSPFGACAINLLFWHADIAVLSMHNHFSLDVFLQMCDMLAAAGITLVPALEATLPIYFKEPWLPRDYTDKNPNPNGPHVLLLASSPQIMADIWKKHFSKSHYAYAPNTQVRDSMEVILDKIEGEYKKDIAIIFAHPLCDSFLPQVGLLERALYGEIPIGMVFDIIKKHAQGVACFNSTLKKDDYIDFENIKDEVERAFGGKNGLENHLKRRHANISAAEAFVKELLKKYGIIYGKMPTRNNINLAFAAEMRERFGVAEIYESDAHNHNLLYAAPFGCFYWINQIGPFGQGYTGIRLPPNSKKPAAGDVIALFHKTKETGSSNIDAVVYYETREGKSGISEERRIITPLQKLFDILEKALHYFGQGIVLAKDTWKSILRKYERDPMAELKGQDLMYMKRGSAFWPY